MPTNEIIKVRIDPTAYSDSLLNLEEIKENWFVNLSKVEIPHDIQCFLQLGETFSLPLIDKPILTMEFIKNIENNLWKLVVILGGF